MFARSAVLALVAAIILVLVLACTVVSPMLSVSGQAVTGLTVQSYDTTIPTQYQSQYSTVQNLLNQFNSSLGPAPLTSNNFTYATELLPANGNQGPDLFNSNNLNGVERNLQALKAMGVKGVTIAVGYPLLDPTFPNSTQYLQYFKTVVSMCHQDGFTVDIESQVLFANTVYSPLTFDWSNLTYSQYVVNHIAQDNLICSQIKPDILEIGVEADTEASLTGYTQLNTPSGWSNYINQLLNGINKNGTKLAAGAGDWLRNTTQWVEGFVGNSNLDFISTHSYPIVSPFLSNLISLGQFAKDHGKRLVFDEEWCTKILQPVNAGGGGGYGGPDATQQDPFSYWIPIDTQYQQLMAKFCQIYPCEYLSPFDGDYYFFAYLTWTPQLDNQTFFDLHSILNPIISQNEANFTVSPTGVAYATLALGLTTPTPTPAPTPNPTQTQTSGPTPTPSPTYSPTPSPTSNPAAAPSTTPTPSSTILQTSTPSLTSSPTIPEFPNQTIGLLLAVFTSMVLSAAIVAKKNAKLRKSDACS